MSLQVKSVSVKPRDEVDRWILDSVDCRIEEGSVTLLLGHTGAGKSTLLDILTGILPPDIGEVLYESESIWQQRRNRGKKTTLKPGFQLRNGIVFQVPEHQLFAKDVASEFQYSLRPYTRDKDEVEQRSRSALQRLGLSDQLLSQSPITLSVGQKRRVVLATVFSTDASWLFLDEPSSGLDPMAVESLLDTLKTWKQTVQGTIVIATHDLDSFLPIADHILLVDQGRVVGSYTPTQLMHQPNTLIEANIGIPSQLNVQLELESYGIHVERSWITAEAFADALHEQWSQQRPMTGIRFEAGKNCANQRCQKWEQAEPSSESEDTTSLSVRIRALDPRAKWVFYFLASIGIVQVSTWEGYLTSAIFTTAVLRACGSQLRNGWNASRTFVVFVSISAILSGLQFGGSNGPIGFSMTQAFVTCRHLYPFLLILCLGLMLPFTTTQIAMKNGLEASLAYIKWTRFPVEAFSLGTSLILRFMPLIKQEVVKFSKIMRARGKLNIKPGTVRFRDLPVILIPLLLSMIQLAEGISIAMEARGYKQIGQRRTSSFQLRFTKDDWWTVVLSIVVCGILILM